MGTLAGVNIDGQIHIIVESEWCYVQACLERAHVLSSIVATETEMSAIWFPVSNRLSWLWAVAYRELPLQRTFRGRVTFCTA